MTHITLSSSSAINHNDDDHHGILKSNLTLTQFLFAPYIVNYLHHLNIKFEINKDILKLHHFSTAALFYSYKKIGITDKTPGTIPGQEIIFPSEILAISNQYGMHSKIAASINKIKLG